MASVACQSYSVPESVEVAYETLPDSIDYNYHVKPILSDKCYMCHGPDKGSIMADLQLNDPESAFAELKNSPGKFAIDPGNPENSELVYRILSTNSDYVMPQPESHLSLNDREKAILIKWIEQGAKYKKHWAFVPPVEVDIPEAAAPTTIDKFIRARLDQEGLKPNGKAGREILLRRLSLDLIGLPPTQDEIENFLMDESQDANEKQVDRLLNSPQYGEQRTLEWMDLARYADTHGYTVDRFRDMSAWRDWVIKSFNQNMPYDTFLTYQLAGDMMENPTRDMRLATAYNRLHPQNMEGGIVPEEFLAEYAADRVSTMSESMLGLTTACARCHDHKYDPISQKNFYQLTSFFDNINESGQISFDNAMPVPTLLLSSPEQDKLMTYISKLIGEKEKALERVDDSEFAAWARSGNREGELDLDKGLVAHFTLDSEKLLDKKTRNQGFTERESGARQAINIEEGKLGGAIKFDGDSWLELPNTGVFGRHEPFTISFWANIPASLKSGNIVHKGDGAIIYNWRGYHLKIVEDKIEIMMAHTAPGNAIIEVTRESYPADKWVHYTLTYDGSSKASGLKLFWDGVEAVTEIKIDNLYKDILFGRSTEPPLQFGARWRGKGIKDALIDEVKVYDRQLSEYEIRALWDWQDLLDISNNNELLKEFYFQSVSPTKRAQRKEIEKLRESLVELVEPIPEISVMEEREVPHTSYLLNRGVYYDKGEEVFPQTPEFIFSMKEDMPKDRLGLASWVVHPENPLTARVAVNRYWQYLFGSGLVKTSEDFGNQGEFPSHPELLDWLATDFIQSGWDVKRLIKQIVLTEAYQRSSEIKSEGDPENRLLARGPVKRLTGEKLRDNVLMASGLLNSKIGGKSVYPYQPEGLWRVNGGTYKVEEGENLYRRSMYTIWKRSVPHPTIATFDAPTRSVCTSRRQETNTPLQALALLNDKVFIESSEALANTMVHESDPKEGIATVFRSLTGRQVSERELQILTDLYEKELLNFEQNPEKIGGWIKSVTGSNEFKVRKAANAVVASTIINSDAVIMSR